MVLVRIVKIRITVKDRVSVKRVRVRVRLRVSVRRSMGMENSACHVYLSVPDGRRTIFISPIAKTITIQT